MYPICVTCDVSNGGRSRDASEEQLLNMPPMFVAREVSKWERSRDASDEHP